MSKLLEPVVLDKQFADDLLGQIRDFTKKMMKTLMMDRKLF